MQTKSVDGALQLKSVSEDEGTFEAYVSIFNNIDSTNEIVMPGAFTASLARWAEKGDKIPFLFSHQLNNLDSHLGFIIEAKQTPEGLWVRGQVDLTEASGRKAFALLKGRRVTEFSIGYFVLSAARGERDGDPVIELRELDLFEVSMTLKGANPSTVLLGTKSSDSAENDPEAAISLADYEELLRKHEALGVELKAALAKQPADADADASSEPAAVVEEPASAPANTADEPAVEPANEAAIKSLALLIQFTKARKAATSS